MKRKKLRDLTPDEAEVARNLPRGLIDFCEACAGEGRMRRIIDDVIFVRTAQPGFAQQFRGETLHVWVACTNCGGSGTIETGGQ